MSKKAVHGSFWRSGQAERNPQGMTQTHQETCTCVSLCLGVLPVCGHVHLCMLCVHEPVCGARVGLEAVHGTCMHPSATGTASNIPTCASLSPLDGGCPSVALL